MINIPDNLYGIKLSSYICSQYLTSKGTPNEAVFTFLHRLLNCELFQTENEGRLYIADFKPNKDDISIIRDSSLENNDNIQVRAFCLDILQQQKNIDRRQPQIDASLTYLKLYDRKHSPDYLLRSITVRSIKAIKNLEFVNEISLRLKSFEYVNWLPRICMALLKSYKAEELTVIKDIIKELLLKAESPNDPAYRMEERSCCEALSILGSITETDLHRYCACSFEKEVDFLNSNKQEHIINMGVENKAKCAYDEIFKVKNIYPDDFKRIKCKLIKEQENMVSIVKKNGIRIPVPSNQEFNKQLEDMLNKHPLKSPFELLSALKRLPFVDKNVYTVLKDNIKSKRSSVMELFGSAVLGNKGQITGTADPETSLDIYTHQILRQQRIAIINSYLKNFFEHHKTSIHDEIGDAIISQCGASFIPFNRRILWAKGIIEMMNDNYIASVHILMPQVEYALLQKAEFYMGSLTKLENEEHQDEPPIGKVLGLLKPFLKDKLFDEFSYFFNTGADCNFRNKIAHGLCELDEIKRFAPYLWWLAIKIYFCDKEIFLDKV